MNRYGVFKGYICTANEDGSIPLNAKAVCGIYEQYDGTLLHDLIAQANLAADLIAAVNKLGWSAPEITSAMRKYDSTTNVKF